MLISILNCQELSWLVLLEITIPNLSLFEESTRINTAHLYLSDSDLPIHPPSHHVRLQSLNDLRQPKLYFIIRTYSSYKQF